MRSSLLPLLAITLLAPACGNSNHSAAKIDHGAPSDVYPAPHTALPQLKKWNGHVQSAPVQYAVTWPGDPIAGDLETFTSMIGASQYWATTTAEYGVGPGVSGGALHIATAAPASISSNAIDTMLQSMFDGTHPEFGTPTANSEYALYFPAGTSIDGQSCDYWLAYHSSVVVTGNIEISYEVIPRCTDYAGLTPLQIATDSASHEMVESATDPDGNVAWVDTDDQNGAWDWLSGGGENADMCQDVANVDVMNDPIGYVVQRSWSNQAAAASHDPCQPSSGPYFNAAPVLPDTASINFGGGYHGGTASVHIAVGESRTIELDLFSDAPTSGPFTVKAVDAAHEYGYPAELSFSLDGTSGVNGEKLYLTITADKAGTGLYNGGSFFYIVTKLGNSQQYWPVFVNNT